MGWWTHHSTENTDDDRHRRLTAVSEAVSRQQSAANSAVETASLVMGHSPVADDLVNIIRELSGTLDTR